MTGTYNNRSFYRHLIIFFSSLLSGLLLQNALPPNSISYFSFIAFVPALVSLRNATYLEWAFSGFVTGLPCGAMPVMSFSSWGAGLYLFPMIYFSAMLSLTFMLSKFICFYIKPNFSWISFPASWLMFVTISEHMLRIPFFISLAFPLTTTEWLGALRFFSVYGMEVTVVSISSLLAAAAKTDIDLKYSLISVVSALLFLRASTLFFEPIGQGFAIIKGIQPALSFDAQRLATWSLDARKKNERILDSLTIEATKSGSALIVWPEEGNGLMNSRLPRRIINLQSILNQGESEAIVGGIDVTPNGKLYNVLQLFNSNGLISTARKKYIVPFAEDNISSGEAHVFNTKQGKIGVSICFDSAFFLHFYQLSKLGASAFLVSSDDSSFGKSHMPEWHVAYSILRSIEFGKSLIFLSNHGPALATDFTGKILSEDWHGEKRQVYSWKIPLSSQNTITMKGGFIAPYIAILFTLLLGFKFQKRTDNLRIFSRSSFVYIVVSLPLTAIAALLSILYLAFSTANARNISLTQLIADVAHRYHGTPSMDGIAPAFKQSSPNTCGAAAASYLLTTLGDLIFEYQIVSSFPLNEASGYSMLDIVKIIKSRGFNATGHHGEWKNISTHSTLPFIAHLIEGHYVVVTKADQNGVVFFDPRLGKTIHMPKKNFLLIWSKKYIRVHTV